MHNRHQHIAAEIFFANDHDPRTRAVRRLRKTIFVDELCWKLNTNEGEERDQFDRSDEGVVYCQIAESGKLVGTFRVLSCAGPYLGRDLFPKLAELRQYPHLSDSVEISRFATLDSARRLAPNLYAVMLDYGWRRGLRGLVAVADLNHERLLRRLGILTRRYGCPGIVGTNTRNEPVHAVAGEIPLADQSSELRDIVGRLLAEVEIKDETLVLGSHGVSA